MCVRACVCVRARACVCVWHFRVDYVCVLCHFCLDCRDEGGGLATKSVRCVCVRMRVCACVLWHFCLDCRDEDGGLPT